MADTIKLDIPTSAAERIARTSALQILQWFKDGSLNNEQAVAAFIDWRDCTHPPAPAVGKLIGYRSTSEGEDWHYHDKPLRARDNARKDPGFIEQALYIDVPAACADDIARIIDPWAFTFNQSEELIAVDKQPARTMARNKANAILSLLSGQGGGK